MKTRIVHTRFWNDGYISNLNRSEKLAFIYILTNDQVGLTGVYELPDNKVVFETGLTMPEWNKIKEKFAKDQKFNFYKGWVKIINLEKYQQFKGDKNEVARKNELSLINKDILHTLSIPYPYPTDTTNNHKSINIINNKGVVKGGYSRLKDITDGELEILARDFKVPIGFVRSKYDDLINYCGSKGKTYRNYYLALRNFVKTDSLKIRKESLNANSKHGIDARSIG